MGVYEWFKLKYCIFSDDKSSSLKKQFGYISVLFLINIMLWCKIITQYVNMVLCDWKINT